MNEYSRIIVTIIRIATDMIATIYDQYLFATLRRYPLGKYASGEACADN